VDSYRDEGARCDGGRLVTTKYDRIADSRIFAVLGVAMTKYSACGDPKASILSKAVV